MSQPKSPPKITPEIILAALDQQDPSALKLLINAIDTIANKVIAGALLKKRVYRRCDVRQTKLDLLQEARLKLFADKGKILRDWNPEEGELDPYLGVIISHLAMDWCRRRFEHLSVDDGDNPPDPPGPDSDNPERQVAMRQAMRLLLREMRAQCTTRMQQEMFHLIVELGLTTDEICTRTGMTPDAAYKWRERFKKLASETIERVLSD